MCQKSKQHAPKGQKHIAQGRSALPWAMCFLGFQPVELSFDTPSFHILNADAALYAESGEECGDYAHDKLEHGLESFFV